MTPYDLGKACLIHLVDVTEAVTCVSNGHRHINYTNSMYKKKCREELCPLNLSSVCKIKTSDEINS